MILGLSFFPVVAALWYVRAGSYVKSHKYHGAEQQLTLQGGSVQLNAGGFSIDLNPSNLKDVIVGRRIVFARISDYEGFVIPMRIFANAEAVSELVALMRKQD